MPNLNEQQLSAVLCNDKRILCMAGAGTGKTSTMLERISHLVDTSVSPSSILALTFTNAAAFEMKERYKKQHPTGLIPEFRTFHSFCYYVLSSNIFVRRVLGYIDTPSIADDAIRKRILREAQGMTNIKASLESLEKKVKRTSAEQFAYDMLLKAQDKLMKKSNTITFDALCKNICKLFKNNAECIQKYKEQYKYIFVDEFQDTDPVQYDFVKSFDESNLFVCGDALQGIYAFRGADSSIIKKLSVNPEWTPIKLYLNYRSTKTICDFANHHSKHASDSFRISIESGLNIEGEPVVERETGFTPYGLIDSRSRDYCINELKTRPGSTAILFRTNKEVNSMQQYFEDHDVPYRKQKKDADIKNILTSVGNNEFCIEWLASFLDAERYADYIRISTLKKVQNQDYDILSFISDFSNVYTVNEKWEIVRAIRRTCKEVDRSVLDRCYDILKIIDCKYLKINEASCATMKDGVAAILEAYLGYSEEPGTDVYIGTIHSVKGLEFDNVYVFGVNNSTFKLNDEENKNLYYVAITRAKKHLVVFTYEEMNF